MAFPPHHSFMFHSTHEEYHHHDPHSPTSLKPFPPLPPPTMRALREEEEEAVSEDGSVGMMMMMGEKKKRLNVEQVKALEKSFEVGNKLEPERKMELAKALGLQPRQIAIWFQNRRARWKTKNLEKEYELLKKQFDSLKAHNDALKLHNHKLHAEVGSRYIYYYYYWIGLLFLSFMDRSGILCLSNSQIRDLLGPNLLNSVQVSINIPSLYNNILFYV